MATFQDVSIGFKKETTYKTGVTVDRFLEPVDESLGWDKTIVQGQGLRVGGRVARSARRVVPAAQGSGDFTVEALSKGMGTLWELLMGSGTSTVVSGSTYQHVFTLADTLPSATIQRPLTQVGGSQDAYTFLGCVCASFDIDFPNNGIVTVKPTWDIGDIATATAYATPSYVVTPNLFHFANGTIYNGTLTSPTTTALGSATTQLADVRGGSLTVNHNLATDRFNLGGAGRKSKPTVGLREISGSLTVEYDTTTWRDAVLNDTAMSMVLTFSAGALSTGLETLQVIVPEIKFDSPLSAANGTDLITTDLTFAGLDNLTAAQPIWVVTRTSDTAL